MKTYPIRLGIFETNSSSSHSFTLGPRGRLSSTIEMDSSGNIKVSTNYWTFCGEKFCDALPKLSYLLCFVYTLFEEGKSDRWSSDSIIKIISDIVLDFTGAKNIEVDLDPETLIDHQSQDIIDPRDLTDPEFIKEFIFNPKTWVYPIWDSTPIEDDFFENSEEEELYTIHFDLPGIEDDISLVVKYGDNRDLPYRIDRLLENYVWDQREEKFQKQDPEDKICGWTNMYSGNRCFGNKKVDFTITLPNK